MEEGRKKLIFPPLWLVILLTVVSTVLLAAVFAEDRDTDTAACVAYLLSFYTLCTVCALCASVFSGYYRSTKTRIHATKYGGMRHSGGNVRLAHNLHKKGTAEDIC